MRATNRLLAALSLALLSATVSAQIPGQNINMVSGTQFPGGDPYLQRQNEPSMAVSTRNPEHLLAGANDYRSVDIPDPQSDGETHDAWLGVFTSLDGGETWRSTLLPGYPQDNSPAGVASPLHSFTVATDPTVRAGTHGLFYYSGLAFDRGTHAPSGVFVATFQDQNNKGNGNAAIEQQKNGNGNPFLYLNAHLVDSGTSGQFLDKPWIAVDIPRAGRTATCSINGQTIKSGYVYVFYTQFTGSKNNPSSKIKVVTSTNCGATWSQPQTLSQSLKLNQGTVAAIDPGTGTVYVAWRQISGVNQPDSIQYAYSSNGGWSFTWAPAAYTFPTGAMFDQPSGSSNTFRTIDVPALAVDASGRLWLAFSQRVNGPTGTNTFGSRIMITTLPRGGSVWSAPFAADGSTVTSLPEGPPVWHQFMPSLSFAYGKLMLIYYDSRWDNQMSVLSCPANTSCSNLSQLALHHKPIPGSGLLTNAGFSAVFGPSISDPIPGIRHEIDVFGVMLDPSKFPPPTAQGFPISQYAYWENPNDKDQNGQDQIEQGYFNTPDLPLFVQGQIPFIGDYIEVAGLSMVPSANGSWAFNTQGKDAPVFHATWTDNRDVIPPPCLTIGDPKCTEDWTKYVPPNGGFTLASTYSSNPNVCPTCATTQPACTATNSGYSGDRNQNIYTSRITGGLMVQFRENQKPLGATTQRAFSLLVRNTVSPLSSTPLGAPSHYRIMLGVTSANQTPSCNITGGSATLTVPGAGTCTPFLDVDINPRTTIARTVTVTSTNASASVNVLVAQMQSMPAPGGAPAFTGLQATAVLNGDPSNISLADPDSVTPDDSNPDLATPYGNITLSAGEVYDPTVDGPGTNAPGINAPGINAPGINAPGITNAANNAPGINSPGIVSVPTNAPGITSVQNVNPTVTVAANAPGINAPGINAPGINAPGINAPGIVNLDYFAPSITNLQDGHVTDYTWRVNNKGNTSSSYNAKEFAKNTGVQCCDKSGNPSGCSKCQLIAHKVYNSPTANRDNSGGLTCDLTVQEQSITVANIPDPTAFTTTIGASSDGSANNPTLSLSPGEGNRLTLRVQAPPVGTQSQVFPFKTFLVGFANDFNGASAASLLISTTALPVAVVGQNYVGAQLQSVGGTGVTAWSVPINPAKPVAATLPVPVTPLPVAPLTLNQAGQISTAVVTAGPGTYPNVNVQVQDSATTKALSTPALDVQQLTINVNRFSLSAIKATGPATHPGFLNGNDSATVTVTVNNEGPATASAATPKLSYQPSAGGGGPAPTLSCSAPSPAAADIPGGSQQDFIFICNTATGNGPVNFTASASATYNSTGAASANASTDFQPQPASPQLIVDTTPPALTLVSVTIPGAQPNTTQPYTTGNWTNQPVTANYACSDNLSGVAAGSPLINVTNPAGPAGTITVNDPLHSTATVTTNNESSNTSISSSCQDVAGNTATPPAAVTPVKIDHTKPGITVSALTAGAPYAAGSWTNKDVTVTYTCTDNLSGPLGSHPVINGFPEGVTPVITQVTALISTAVVTLTAETSGTNLNATCSDNATNAGDGMLFGPIMIDKTPPVITITSPTDGATYIANQPINSAYGCTDIGGSGVATCLGPAQTPFIQTVPGMYPFTVTSMDVAGNPQSRTNNYSVAYYNFTGFQAPLQPGGTAAAPSNSGTFIEGTSIPLAWQLTSPTTNPATPVIDTNTLTGIHAISDSACAGAPPAGSVSVALYPSTLIPNPFSFDAGNQQFLFNWDTSTFNDPNTGVPLTGCFNIVVSLNDGSVHTTILQLTPAFSTIAYVTTDTAGDSFVVGTVPPAQLAAINMILLPSSLDQQFANPITLETNYTVPSYVPSVTDRLGDFSGYPGLVLTDPATGNPIANNMILPEQLGPIYVWRIPPHPAIQQMACSAEPGLRSVEGTVTTSIQFNNQTQGSVNVYWINYAGQRVLYNTLAAGESYVQATFLTHPWVVTDNSTGTCLGIWLPTELPGVAAIQ